MPCAHLAIGLGIPCRVGRSVAPISALPCATALGCAIKCCCSVTRRQRSSQSWGTPYATRDMDLDSGEQRAPPGGTGKFSSHFYARGPGQATPRYPTMAYWLFRTKVT